MHAGPIRIICLLACFVTVGGSVVECAEMRNGDAGSLQVSSGKNSVEVDNGRVRAVFARRSGRVVQQYFARDGRGWTLVAESLKPDYTAGKGENSSVVFEDFEKNTYQGWEVEGTAFGGGPIKLSEIPAYQSKVNGRGRRVVNSHNVRGGEDVAAGDAHKGKLTSRSFKIKRRFIHFLIGGGNHPTRTCVNLLIDGKPVESVTGHNRNTMRPAVFNVAKYKGRKARIQIVDNEPGGWGNIGVDNIVFNDSAPGDNSIPLYETRGKLHRYLLSEILSDVEVLDRGTETARIRLSGKCNGAAVEQTVTLGSGNERFHIEVRAKLAGSPPKLEYLLLPLTFNLDRAPSFVHTPHTKGPSFLSRDASDQIIADRVFYAPAVILQEEGLFCALAPDLATINEHRVVSPDARRTRKTGKVFATPVEGDKYTMPTGLDLSVRSGLTDRPLMCYGFMDSVATHHMRWPHPNDGSMVRTLERGDVRFAFDLFVSADAPAHRGYQRVSRHQWAQYGAPTFKQPRPQAMPFDEYAKVIYPAAIAYQGNGPNWSHKAPPNVKPLNGWVQFEMNGQTVGGWRNCHWYDMLSNMPWWNNPRDAIGLYFWGKRMGDESLVKKSKLIINLSMQAPQKGVFSTIYRVRSKKWAASHWDVPAKGGPNYMPAGFRGDGNGSTYHTISCSITALHLLRYNRLCEPDPRIVPYCRRYADFMLEHLDDRGTLPGWFTPDLRPSDVLRESGEGGAHIWFFAELYRATKDRRYLDTAKKLAGYMMREVLPRQRWRDIEVYFSCGKRPINYFDHDQGQDPRGTLPMIWAGGGFAAVYEATGDRQYLEAGERAIDYAALYQTCWDPHFIYTAYSFGGFDTDNGDAAWTNAHSAWTPGPLLWYGKELGRQDLLERAVAAARSSVSVINHPRLIKNNIYRFPNYPYGLGGENICHEGHEQSCGRTSPGCGEQSGVSAGLSDVLRGLGGIYINIEKDLAIGVDGVVVDKVEVERRTIRLSLKNQLSALPVPYERAFRTELRIEGLPDAGQYTLIVNQGAPRKATARQLASRQIEIKPFNKRSRQKRLLQKRSLQAEDTIVFLGDSITEAGVGPNGYVALTSQAIAKAYPDLNIRVIGAGISGHRVPDCQKRLNRDVLQKKPTIVLIYIGINDVWQWISNRGSTKEVFEAGLRDMISRIHSVGARVILCTPTVIGEKTDGTNKFDKMLDEYSGISRKVAKETNSQLLDLREAFMAYLKEHNTGNVAKGILTTDTVHLNRNGNSFLSDLVLNALNVPSGD